jgi:ABC-2 type transport system permease protein
MMFWQIAWFEIRYWLRSWMLWIFLFVVSVLVCGAVSSNDMMVDFNLSNTYRNAPFAIAFLYAATSVFAVLMTIAFVNFAALRDFSYNTHQMMFCTPVHRRDLLLGRFFGATVVSVIPMLGVSVGILVANYLPFSDKEHWETVIWGAHLKGILLFAVPNTFLTAAILFAVAVVWRRDIAPFIATILLIIGRGVTASLLMDPQREWIRALFDSFGAITFAIFTKYWTVADKNNLAVGFSGLLVWNRLLWIAAGCAAFAFAYSRFSFAEKRTKSKAVEADERPTAVAAAPPMPHPHMTDSPWAKFLGAFKIHLRAMARNTAFVVIVMIASAICIFALALNATLLNNHTFPVTYQVIDLIRGSLNLFLIIVITYFSNDLVWKDRDDRVDEIADATPTPEWVPLCGTAGYAHRHGDADSTWRFIVGNHLPGGSGLRSLPVRSVC